MPTTITSAQRIQKGPRPCACGCGEMTKGGVFRPGHDARVAYRLLQLVAGLR
jgi:hypothetical protein